MAAEEARARLRDLCRRLLRACGRALSVGRLCAALLEPWAPMAANALPAKVRACCVQRELSSGSKLAISATV